MKHRAFTLIETIIVVAIILVLASILFVVLKPVRVQAKHSVCASNARQIFLAMQEYSSDNDSDSEFPELHGMTYFTTGNIKQVLAPYGVPESLWTCPSATQLKTKLFSTYGLAPIVYKYDPSSPEFQKKRKINIDRDNKFGSSAPIVMCPVHDALEFQPMDNDPHFQKQPWLIWINGTGAAKTGRCPMMLRTWGGYLK